MLLRSLSCCRVLEGSGSLETLDWCVVEWARVVGGRTWVMMRAVRVLYEARSASPSGPYDAA